MGIHLIRLDSMWNFLITNYNALVSVIFPASNRPLCQHVRISAARRLPMSESKIYFKGLVLMRYKLLPIMLECSSIFKRSRAIIEELDFIDFLSRVILGAAVETCSPGSHATTQITPMAS